MRTHRHGSRDAGVTAVSAGERIADVSCGMLKAAAISLSAHEGIIAGGIDMPAKP